MFTEMKFGFQITQRFSYHICVSQKLSVSCTLPSKHEIPYSAVVQWMEPFFFKLLMVCLLFKLKLWIKTCSDRQMHILSYHIEHDIFVT